MSLFDRFIKWLAEGLQTKKPKAIYHRGKLISRAHAVQLKRQKANKRLHRWWRWHRFWR